MAGAFDNLFSADDSARSLAPGDLALLKAQLAKMQGGPRDSNGTIQWGGADGTPLDNWVIQNYARGTQIGSGDQSDIWYDPHNTFTTFSRPVADSAGKLIDVFDQDGKWLSREAGADSVREMNTAIALMAAGYFGGGALNSAVNGAGGAGAASATSGMTASQQAAMMAANGMTDAEIAAALGSQGANAAGLTGVTGGAATTSAGTGLSMDKIASGAKDMLGQGGLNQLGQTALAMTLAKDVKDPNADPNLTTAITGLKTTADDANARALANDEYFRSVFAPRYLQAMDDQIATGKMLTDFQVGLAKKYDDRYWNTTAKQQDAYYKHVDAYDTDAARSRLAGEAGANADMQNAAAMQSLVRDLNRRGLNPNSGVVLSNMRQQAQTGALQKTMAMNMAREAARKEGLNMRAVAAGLGGNLTGATAQFAGGAGSTAGLGMNGIQGAQNGVNSNNASWLNTMNLGTNALSTLGNYGMNLTNLGFNANMMNTQGWNQMLGYGLGMFGSGRNAGSGG